MEIKSFIKWRGCCNSVCWNNMLSLGRVSVVRKHNLERVCTWKERKVRNSTDLVTIRDITENHRLLLRQRRRRYISTSSPLQAGCSRIPPVSTMWPDFWLQLQNKDPISDQNGLNRSPEGGTSSYLDYKVYTPLLPQVYAYMHQSWMMSHMTSEVLKFNFTLRTFGPLNLFDCRILCAYMYVYFPQCLVWI